MVNRQWNQLVKEKFRLYILELIITRNENNRMADIFKRIFIMIAFFLNIYAGTPSNIRVVGEIKLPKIIKDPVSITTSLGLPFEFSVIVDGNNITYTWQVMRNESNVWEILTNNNSSKIIFDTLYEKDHLNKYRCIISNSFGKDTSKVSTIRVSELTKRCIPCQQDSLREAIKNANDGDTIQLASGACY